ncbi:LysE family translocator [Lacibacterium aquatile]|uniref:LysE family translocator n=1 Tax=Lacibacterium aquatile TaxID=1168082 RepID=A0ABW5DRS2_9PROT
MTPWDLALPAVLTALTLWMAAVISPGPSFMLVSQLAASRSRPAAFAACLGISTGSAIYASLTLFGLSFLITGSALVVEGVRIAGGCYLIWLGIQSWRRAGNKAAARKMAETTIFAGYRLGLATALTNPKAIAFFLGLFGAIFTPEMGTAPKVATLIAGFTINITWYALVCTLFSTEAVRRRYQGMKGWLDRIFGSIFILFGLRLTFGGRLS